ncbi:hypothetical protein SAMN02910317_02487 [Ruminococcaceae bacterium FB2012]|nr:hypothetical protein SAMN02910317_02487 [Ruminococcaceae bacterium FB2012]
MALGRKKKEESTNDKIIRLFQEGKSVEDIVGEVALRADIVTGVIQRKLGPDAVPDAAVPHERSQAAAVINSASNASETPAAPAVPEPEEVEGMSKLERYMFEKKKKMESEPAPAPAPSAPSVGEMEGISLADLPASEPEPEPVPLVNEPPKEQVHRVSLVDDYKRQVAERDSNIPKSVSNMDGISLESPAVPPAPSVPSYTVPSPGEEYAEMEALVPPDVESTEISDAPILAYSGEPEPAVEETVEEITEPAAEFAAESEEAPAAPASSADGDVAGRAANKMKAFAMSQIEANNARIAELENQSALVKNEYSSRIEEANTALTLSQSNFDTVESELSEAYKAGEKAREEHAIAIAAIDDDYRRKLAALDEEYKTATFEANNKYQEFDDKNRQDIERLDGEKIAAQADLVAKRKAVAEIHSVIDTEGAKIAEQIKALKEENAGYQQFLN